MNTCFFIGHREAPQSLLPKLREAVEEKIISQQTLHFVVGHYGNFDALAAQAVMDAKKRHPEVTLTLLLPYPMSRIPAVCHCVCQPVHDRSQRLADCVCDARGQQRRAVSGGGAGAPWGAAGGEFGGGSTSQSASLTAPLKGSLPHASP